LVGTFVRGIRGGLRGGDAMTVTQTTTAAAPLPTREFARVRQRTIFDYCKWDPQVGDVSVLSPFPLVIDRATWEELARSAEELAAETLTAEEVLIHRTDLHRRLGLPGAV